MPFEYHRLSFQPVGLRRFSSFVLFEQFYPRHSDNFPLIGLILVVFFFNLRPNIFKTELKSSYLKSTRS
jgi:hypothetical protein